MKKFDFTKQSGRDRYFIVYLNEELILEVIDNIFYLSIQINNKRKLDLLLRLDSYSQIINRSLFKDFLVEELLEITPPLKNLAMDDNVSRLEFLETIAQH